MGGLVVGGHKRGGDIVGLVVVLVNESLVIVSTRVSMLVYM